MGDVWGLCPMFRVFLLGIGLLFVAIWRVLRPMKHFVCAEEYFRTKFGSCIIPLQIRIKFVRVNTKLFVGRT